MHNQKLVNPLLLPTVSMPGMSPLISFLAKIEKVPLGSLSNPPAVSVLRYGNRTQAEAKRTALAGKLSQEGNSSAVIQIESRFLVAVYPAEYDIDLASCKLVAKVSPAGHKRQQESLAVRPPALPPFATVSGPRIDPRNRHNQNGAGPVYCKERAAPEIGNSIADLLPRRINRRAQHRAVSDRLNGRG